MHHDLKGGGGGDFQKGGGTSPCMNPDDDPVWYNYWASLKVSICQIQKREKFSVKQIIENLFFHIKY